jgi:putative N6-adenine-specific DNA methylase
VNLESRIATRVLWRVGGGSYRNEDDIFRIAGRLDWPAWFSVDRTLRVYVTAVKSPVKSTEFITLRIKDAICDRFRVATNGRRPSVDTANPDLRIHAFLTADSATIYLDTSGEALYRRGQKHSKVQAPLKENLAAGILRLAGWQPGTPLLDPMSGSGTFLLEAAQMSLQIAPGLSRPADGFALARLSNFDAALWRQLRAAAQARRLAPRPLPLWGSDQDADAVARTEQNLAVAGLDGVASISQAEILALSAPAAAGVLVANPPYGERIGEADELAAFYPRLGDALKAKFAGWECYFLSADTRLPKLIGLKADHRTPLYNGALECRLYHFHMVAGSRRPGQSTGEMG